MDLNLTAYFLLSQALAPGMLERRSGSIIMIGSINGTLPFPQRLAYCVSKGGREHAAEIRVSAARLGYHTAEQGRPPWRSTSS